tara:strand:+ start:248 stop:676 length:429 start_codon:yes stop_codon:yes gene_type:complete
MKTASIKKNDIVRDWYLVDAADKTLGRISTKIAHILRGKNKVNFTPHLDMSDFIIVINADKVKLTGNKANKKEYWKHTGYPGSGTLTLYKDLKSDKPETIIEKSVKGMLPHNKLGSQLITHLKVYCGNVHPHEAQKPKLLEL